jgi:flagellar hook assembly protein FlgD
LYVKDDGNQKIAGGTRQQFTNVDTINGGKPYLPQLSSENSICMLEAVVSESYDSTITFVTTNSQEIVLSNQLKLTVYENPSSRLDPVSIAFELAQPGDVQVYIFDITGRLVFSREFVYNSSGTKTVLWDGKENKGLLAGSGVYLVRVVNGDVSATAKFIRQD